MTDSISHASWPLQAAVAMGAGCSAAGWRRSAPCTMPRRGSRVCQKEADADEEKVAEQCRKQKAQVCLHVERGMVELNPAVPGCAGGRSGLAAAASGGTALQADTAAFTHPYRPPIACSSPAGPKHLKE